MPNKSKIISGFSKLSKQQKIDWINSLIHESNAASTLKNQLAPPEKTQKIFDGLSENVISNYILPFSVAPNFLINGKQYCVPMVTEESSVVAAAASAAKYWALHGGIKAEVISMTKLGQVHFCWNGSKEALLEIWDELVELFTIATNDLTKNMRARGGGIQKIELKDFTEVEPEYYQIMVSFDTKDSMGANFINSILERIGDILEDFVGSHPKLKQHRLEIVMAILSNYTPECIVRASVECRLDQEELPGCGQEGSLTFAKKLFKAVRIAEIDPHRATTHNKGIFNGVDAVIIATGNDFRAVEACGHTYASRNGKYESLSHCELTKTSFKFWLDLPLAVGTVGGLTTLHPLAKLSLDLLGNPSAEELMQIVAATGLMQNYAALKSLVTTGIQHGHMKMHLSNIINHLEASPQETQDILAHFQEKKVTFTAVREYLASLRQEKVQ